jgi:small subunit ribosomal protein S17
MAKKKRIGVVVSTKSKKTITVAIQRKYQHPKYAKSLIQTKKFMAHDEQEQCTPGDVVLLEECSPFSKCKNWILIKILKKHLN